MSVPGFLRWQNYRETGHWICRGLVKFSEQVFDSQDGGKDGASGMDIQSVNPKKVSYSLRLNQGAPVKLSYHAQVVHPEGIFGDAIRIDLDHTFCIGPDNHYALDFYVAPDGLMDRVGNKFSFDNGQPTQKYRFYLEHGNDGNLWVMDEVNHRKRPVRFEQGVFYLPLLTPLAD